MDEHVAVDRNKFVGVENVLGRAEKSKKESEANGKENNIVQMDWEEMRTLKGIEIVDDAVGDAAVVVVVGDIIVVDKFALHDEVEVEAVVADVDGEAVAQVVADSMDRVVVGVVVAVVVVVVESIV